jgi:D-erythro-7,8-dihydroneopterin triphosphate epimerase
LKQPQHSKEGARPLATINIRNLRLRTFIGFNPEEREKKQDVVINIDIRYRMAKAVLDDRVEEALNYKVITKEVIECVEQGRFLLLEKLVGDVLVVCSSHPDICWSRVTIEKPHALRFADSVSLTLEYQADTNTQPQLLEKAS